MPGTKRLHYRFMDMYCRVTFENLFITQFIKLHLKNETCDVNNARQVGHLIARESELRLNRNGSSAGVQAMFSFVTGSVLPE
jgi:hypothetical protein